MQGAVMRPLPPLPLKRSQTLESISSVDSDKTMSVTSSDRPEIIRMLPKVDVEIKFNGEKLTNERVSRSQSVTSLSSLRSIPMSLSHMASGGDDLSRRMSVSSVGGLSGFSTLSSSPDIQDDVNLSADEIRMLRIENQELQAADHRQKAEICDLKAKIFALNGQLSKCRQLAMALKSYVK